MKQRAITKSLVLILLILCVKTSFSQWSSNTSVNTPVCVDLGRQIDLRMADDGKGGVFVTWKDYRSGGGVGLPDIYIQYLNEAGYPQWTTNGVALCTDPADQSTPSIVSDMAGGVIVAWSDWRTGVERDLFAQRIDSAGVIQWTINGVGVANKPEREHNEKIVSDDAGGAIIVWEQQGGNGNWDLWAQRIDPSGAPVWPVGGVPLCTVDANRLNPKVQKDGKGGAIITWQDYRNLTDYNVYAQRISATGSLLWGTGALAICSAQGAQIDPKIDPDSATGGAYIVWVDKRNLVDYDIYAQKVDENGNILWANDGVVVTNAIGNQSAQDILSNGNVTNGLIVTWKDVRSGNYDIYAQKLSPAGVRQWTNNDMPICTSINDQLNPNILHDKAGGAIIVWQDASGIDTDIKSQRINGNGVIQWALNGVVVSNAVGNQSSPKNVSDGNGGAIYAWQDRRDDASMSNDIYAHHLYSDGSINLSINENSASSTLSSFPNPFTDNFTIAIDLQKEEKIAIKLLDVLGQELPLVVASASIQSKGKHTLQISAEKAGLPKGIFFISVTGNGWTKTIKVIKA
ncbi:MAG: T9SS type A sorting domain-containing protein [Bacteroidota bacterium]